jgi:hypothetical protein
MTMKLLSSLAPKIAAGSLSILILFGTGAAGAEPASPRSYSAEQIAIIMHMRDNGDGLADVAKVVGGTRKDVKAAERAEKQRRKESRHENRDAGVAVASSRR